MRAALRGKTATRAEGRQLAHHHDRITKPPRTQKGDARDNDNKKKAPPDLYPITGEKRQGPLKHV